jgi:hypothetical protein
MPIAPRKQSSLSAVMSKFALFLKATPQDQLDDVADILDSADVSHGDIFNRDGKPMSQSESPTGVNLGMHGDGIARMTQTYSTPTAANEADATAKLGDRLSSLEKAMSGIAACLSIMLKADERFPDSEADESEDDDSEETTKAEGPAEISLADAFSFLGPKLSKRAAAAAKAVEERAAKAKTLAGLATPPDMLPTKAFMKSQTELLAERLDADPSLTAAQRIEMRVRNNALALQAHGVKIDTHDPRICGSGYAGHVNPVADRY